MDNNTIKLETGLFDTYRTLGMFKLLEKDNQNAYVATEFLSTNGYFESPQNFKRINLFGKYSHTLNSGDLFSLTLSHFDNQWDASGQIPQRAVNNGMISRFGAIDDTEGGFTSRNNALLNFKKNIDENTFIKNSLYISKYDFELYSNFTFYLEDQTNGDQIKQKENRTIYGLNSEYNHSFTNSNINGSWQAGFSLKNDQSKDNELSHTLNRKETLNQIQLGTINETNLAAYLATTIDINKWVFNPSIRLDYFDFQYHDQLNPEYTILKANETIISPKLNILFNINKDLQLYLKTGKGFHSNDTRVVVTENDKNILPAAYGFDFGYIWKPKSNMFLNLAYWYLYLEQEFLYVGDAGIVEPSGKTKRQGLELSYRYQPLQWLFWNIDTNYTVARAIDNPKEEDFIPLAPDFTLNSALNFTFKSGIYGSINTRHLANRPANEDNSIIAKGYTIVDLNAGYKWKKMNFGIQIQNLFDTDWNETQFATESRLRNETESVEEIHFTPSTPFFLKTMIQYNF